MNLRFLIFFIILILVSFPIGSSAQPSTKITINVVPPSPAPYEEATISLNSYVYNLNSVLISWSVNGKTVASEVGKKSLFITAPAQGKETSVKAAIHLPEGVVETKVVIKPAVMVLLWQANDSYVPPFYRGKALPTADSEVKVVAMPEVRTNAELVNSKNLIYAWKKDYTNNVDGSGYGKNSFIYTNDYLEDSNNISVTASTVDQNYSSQASIDIKTSEPKILFYKNDNRLGTLWNMALIDTHKIQEKEIVEAVPYFISPKEIQNPTLMWNWFINGKRVDLTGFKKNLMPLQAETGTHGTSLLRLEVENRDKIFQSLSKEINIEF